MDLKAKMRRPSTSKRVLEAMERGLALVDPSKLNRYERESHEKAQGWLLAIRKYNRFRLNMRMAWDSANKEKKVSDE